MLEARASETDAAAKRGNGEIKFKGPDGLTMKSKIG
jgi:hypothetical protein